MRKELGSSTLPGSLSACKEGYRRYEFPSHRDLSLKVIEFTATRFDQRRLVLPFAILGLEDAAYSWSKLLALYSLDDAHSWVLHDRSLDAAPHLAHCSKKTFRLVYAVEFEIDDGVVWIVNGP